MLYIIKFWTILLNLCCILSNFGPFYFVIFGEYGADGYVSWRSMALELGIERYDSRGEALLPPPTPVDGQTRVKTLLSRNLVCDQ